MQGRSSKIRDRVLEVSGGVVSYLADFLLFMITYGVELSTAGYGSRAAARAYARTMQELYGIREKSAYDSLSVLRRKGLINYSRNNSDISITAAGKRRLRRVVPTYERVRTWDGRLYLITYDIDEEKRMVRDYFRNQLKKLGCGMLQASVWITPYDPREVLRRIIRCSRLESEVLISYAGKGSNVAGTDFKGLVRRIYHLDGLNKRYKEFLQQPLKQWPHYRVAVAFYSILKDDPQLPFELLPSDWQGDVAFRKFSAIAGKSLHSEVVIPKVA